MQRRDSLALSRWRALTRYLDDGCLEIDNFLAERALRTVALSHKNYLFANSDAGRERAAAIYTLLRTAKLNGLDVSGMRRAAWIRCCAHRAFPWIERLSNRWSSTLAI
jgi:transposase